ncbi:MAG TPA: glycogen synthase GlgA [Chthoniobacteraceae bacterium]|nr:glycogen synthase GlgA [Chthoniobacteraceae bacterium]
MKILMATSEMAPLARSGGLGDVLETLPSELQKRGHEVSVALPYYRSIREGRGLKIKNTGVKMTIQVGAKRLDAEVLECIAPNGVQVFLVRRDEYFDRSGFYGADGRAYEDNAERFVFFTKAVVELARRMKPAPDIIHAHDWQTALAPVFVHEYGLPFKTVLTIHNVEYQGVFWGIDFSLTNLPGSYFNDRALEFYTNVNFLKGGIVFADAITTVSERYAREIQTPEFGSGLERVLQEHSGKLTGILNGADSSIWNPSTDKWLPKKYRAGGSMSGKKVCRETLLSKLGLDPDPKGPVFAMVTRLAEQKGFDIFLPLLDRLLADDVRLIVLGEGDTAYERELLLAQMKHREQFSFKREFDDPLAHLIEAGADITLMPSRFEPCGLSAMYSLKYGTIPVVRASGGLYQIVKDYDPTTGDGNGFQFFDYTAEALWDSIQRAKKVFADPQAWKALMQRAMESDFSWSTASAKYEQVYEKLVPAANRVA